MLRLSCELSPEFTGGWINGPVQKTGEQSIQDLVSLFFYYYFISFALKNTEKKNTEYMQTLVIRT